MRKGLASSTLPWVLALGLSACHDAEPDPGASPGPLPGSGQTPTTSNSAALLGLWQLVTLQPAGEPSVSIPEPQRFVADFQGGVLAVRADCNRCGASYDAGSGTLAVGRMACTLAGCATAPLDTQFAGLLQQAVTWRIQGEQLELSSGAGTLRFKRPAS